MLALDCQHFTQTRIATIDSYPVLFILFSWLFMLRFMQRDIVRLPVKKLLPDLALSGLFMGLGIASKWIGVYSGAGLAVAFFWTIFRHMRMAATSAHLLKTDKSLSDEDRKILTLRDQTTMKRVLVICLWCLLFFVAIPLAIYLLAYIPYFAYAHFDNLKDYLTAVWNAQLRMFSYHSKPGLGMDHPFYSPWYEWIFNQRPMYYASPTYVNTPGWSYAIWCFGNPAIWSAALVGFAYTVFMWAKRHRYTLRKDGETLHWTAADWDVTMPFLLLSALSQFLPWVLVPRGTYIYHYFATTPFLMLSITVLLRDITRRFPKTGKWLLGIFLGVCLVMFVAYFPYASGTLTPTWWLDFMEQFLRIYY
jgi:dolichyl-phosphate-mannose-protein mannosyltransferase